MIFMIDRFYLSLLTATLLILFAAAAWTWVVRAYFRLTSDIGLDLLRFLRLTLYVHASLAFTFALRGASFISRRLFRSLREGHFFGNIALRQDRRHTEIGRAHV